jgi:hypothetical protein
MEHVMDQKTAQYVIKTAAIVQLNPHVAMANVMAQKTVIHVELTVVLVAHFHQPVVMVNAMAMRIVRIVLKIVAPI